MIISIHIDKAFDKIKHQFMIKKNPHPSRQKEDISQYNKEYLFFITPGNKE